MPTHDSTNISNFYKFSIYIQFVSKGANKSFKSYTFRNILQWKKIEYT